MTTLILSLLINASCVDGKRGDPVFIENSHYIYYLKNEKEKCLKDVNLWNKNEINAVCACKKLKYPGMKDRAMLKCITRKDKKIYSKTMAVYYYYNLIDSCNKLSEKLEKQLY